MGTPDYRGQPPFLGKTPIAVLMQHLENPPPPLVGVPEGLTVAAQDRGDRPYLGQSLQAERGVGSKYMLIYGELKRFNSNPDLSTPANLQRLGEASLATTGEILREVHLSWNLA